MFGVEFVIGLFSDVTIFTCSPKKLYEVISKVNFSKLQNKSDFIGLKRTLNEIRLDR